jgi:heme/copper-type cytochrome/quinol oxidase subunit 3
MFGIFAVLSALWLLVEALNAAKTNEKRIRIASYNVAFWMLLTWVFAGQWYIEYYPAQKALIMQTSWSFAHSFFMEVKEHIFFIPLVLSFYLVILTTRNQIHNNKTARKLVLMVSCVVILLSLGIEAAGAIIDQASKVAYTTTGVTQ